MGKKYFEITNKSLANGLSFLGFKYYKFGFGMDTVYSFEDVAEVHIAVTRLLNLKKEIQNLNK